MYTCYTTYWDNPRISSPDPPSSCGGEGNQGVHGWRLPPSGTSCDGFRNGETSSLPYALLCWKGWQFSLLARPHTLNDYLPVNDGGILARISIDLLSSCDYSSYYIISMAKLIYNSIASKRNSLPCHEKEEGKKSRVVPITISLTRVQNKQTRKHPLHAVVKGTITNK